GIGPSQVSEALARENQEVPAGRVRRGDTENLVRVTGRVRDPRAFADVVVDVRNGVPVRIGDVGTVVDGTVERRSASFMGGTPAVSVEILKIAGTNTVEVADAVRKVAEEMKSQLPSDVQLLVVRDDSERIRDALASVQHELVLGAILTVIIIYFFLNSWRSTVITGLALPISIISAFFIMWVFGFTVNTMTLLALALSIGLLIDDAIVVRENIVRHLEMGKDHYRAAKEGTDEIGLAVLSTTLAVVAVFVPVAFMGGQIGMIFFQFGVTVAFAVLVSLFVSFTLDPMLSSVWPDPEVEHGGHAETRKKTKNPVRKLAFAFDDWFERMSEKYRNGLAWALNHRALMVTLAVGSVAGAFSLFPLLGFTWLPEYDAGEFNVSFRVPPGSRIEYTVQKGSEIVKFLRQQPEVTFASLSVGGGGGMSRGSNGGQIFVRLAPKEQRTKDMFQIQNELRVKLAQVPGVRPQITGSMSIFGGYRQPIQIYVQGPEPTRLKLAAEQVLQTVRAVPGVAEPSSSDEGEIPQLDVRVDRQQAWAAGLAMQTIGGTLQPLFQGQRATRWEDPNGYSHDVMVVYPDSSRVSPEDVARIPVLSNNIDPRTGLPATIPLSQVAEIRPGVGPQQIERGYLERRVSISAGVLPGFSMGNVADAAREALDGIGLPTGYRTIFGGDVQNLTETKGYVLEALLLAVVFIYLIIASIFGSFIQPLSIMLALPLSFLGVALGLLVTGGSLNVMSMIGIIMLMGLVTKNGILLIDFVNKEREAGKDRRTAILNSARIRVRPIIMTTAAMIFGMLPLALALGEGAEQRAPMAHAVIGGLITSTLLTLFIVPVVYTLLDDLTMKVLGKKEMKVPLPVGAEAGVGD
ncbi:MAG TPA: efflux RND transporter permease subunit, partial [Gemmatimonadaceae bacterium]|nr:efflux RND transporter permease subunit [Gemmatimonadaceae bacterium]